MAQQPVLFLSVPVVSLHAPNSSFAHPSWRTSRRPSPSAAGLPWFRPLCKLVNISRHRAPPVNSTANINSPVLAASTRLWTSPFKGQHGAHNYFKDVIYAMMRTQLGNMHLDQETYTRVHSTEAYLAFCKTKNIDPETVTLPSGTKAHWFGNKDAKRVIVWFHGTRQNYVPE